MVMPTGDTETQDKGIAQYLLEQGDERERFIDLSADIGAGLSGHIRRGIQI